MSSEDSEDRSGELGAIVPEMRERHRKPVQARSEETRMRILQKAREAFAEFGFAGANIREIAREAGVTHSMITYHFGSKDQLWRESVRDMFDLIDREVFQPLASEQHLPDADQYRNLVRRYVRYSAQHPEHARIVIAETISGGERLDWMANEFVKTSHSFSVPWMQSLMDKGIIRSLPMVSFLYAFTGMVQLPFALAKEAQIVFDYEFMTDEAIERHADAVLALVMV